jgi:hypothetical protein
MRGKGMRTLRFIAYLTVSVAWRTSGNCTTATEVGSRGARRMVTKKASLGKEFVDLISEYLL